MTALFLQWTPVGFVLAADGRSTNEQTCEITSETVQKIFQIGGPGRRLAYAMTGALTLGAPDPESADLNLSIEIRKAIETLSKTKTKDLFRYVSALAQLVRKVIHDAHVAGRIQALPVLPQPERQNEGGHTILRMIVAGFCNDKPEFVEARIYHENGTIRDAQVRSQDLELTWMSGVPEVSHALSDPADCRFAPYQPFIPKDRLPTLNEVIEVARQYITACGSLEALAINPSAARGIGGHITIASISQNSGFQWAKGYEPIPTGG